MDGPVETPSTSPTSDPIQESDKRSWRHTKYGSILLSWDFLLGLVIGFGTTIPVIFGGRAADRASTILLTAAGIGAGVAALVLTSLTMLLGVVTPAYRALLKQTSGGLVGITRPYKQVVVLAVVAAVLGLIGGLYAPLTHPVDIRGIDIGPAINYALVAMPLFVLIWAVLGCVQVSGQLLWHWEQSLRAQDASDRIDAVKKRSNHPR